MSLNASLAHAGVAIFTTFLAVQHPSTLLACTCGISSLIISRDLPLTKAIKVFAEVTFGLGSVVAYIVLPVRWRTQYLEWFTVYINSAVVGNIAMMALVPSGGTWRGLVSPVLCLALSFWLSLQAHEKKWKTVEFQDNVFLFNSSSLSYVLHHACYRTCLLSLPSFDQRKYLLLEPISLSTMCVLSWVTGRPVGHVFGYADTIAVASAAVISTFVHIPYSPPILTDQVLDYVVVPIQVMVLASSLYNIRHLLTKNAEI